MLNNNNHYNRLIHKHKLCISPNPNYFRFFSSNRWEFT